MVSVRCLDAKEALEADWVFSWDENRALFQSPLQTEVYNRRSWSGYMQILEGCPHKEKAVQQNANTGSLTGLVGSENHSYLDVGADTGEGGEKKD